MIKLVPANNSINKVHKLIFWQELTVHIVILFTAESDEYYGLMQQLATVPFRQLLNPVFEPYKDVLISTMSKIVEMKCLSHENLLILVEQLMKLKDVSKVTTKPVEITAKTAAQQAGVSAVVMGGMMDVAILVCLMLKDYKNADLSLKRFKEQLVLRSASAIGSSAGGAAAAAAGAAVGTMIRPGFGTMIGTIMGSLIGGTVGAKVGHFIGKKLTE